jgi:hypothetical protein
MVTNARVQNLLRFKRVGLIAIAVIVLVPLLFVGVSKRSHHGTNALTRTQTAVAVTATGAPRPAGAATAAPTSAARPAATTAAGGAAAPAYSAAAATTAPAYAVAPAATTAAGASTSGTGNRGTASDAVGANVPNTPSGVDQLIIRTAAITVIVQDVAGTQAQIWSTAEGLGGFVTNSTASGSGDEIRGQITIRVPTVAYATAMDRLRKFGKVDSEKSDAQDVSEEYVDISSRRTNLELTLQQLQGFLGQAKNVDEALKVQSQLNIVQNDLERIKGRMAYLENRANFSTITATLLPVVEKKPAPTPTPVPTSSWSFQHSVDEQWDRSLHGLENIVDGVLAIFVGGWWILLPLVVATIVFVRWVRQRRPMLQTAPATVPVTPTPPADAT